MQRWKAKKSHELGSELRARKLHHRVVLALGLSTGSKNLGPLQPKIMYSKGWRNIFV